MAIIHANIGLCFSLLPTGVRGGEAWPSEIRVTGACAGRNHDRSVDANVAIAAGYSTLVLSRSYQTSSSARNIPPLSTRNLQTKLFFDPWSDPRPACLFGCARNTTVSDCRLGLGPSSTRLVHQSYAALLRFPRTGGYLNKHEQLPASVRCAACHSGMRLPVRRKSV